MPLLSTKTAKRSRRQNTPNPITARQTLEHLALEMDASELPTLEEISAWQDQLARAGFLAVGTGPNGERTWRPVPLAERTEAELNELKRGGRLPLLRAHQYRGDNTLYERAERGDFDEFPFWRVEGLNPSQDVPETGLAATDSMSDRPSVSESTQAFTSESRAADELTVADPARVLGFECGREYFMRVAAPAAALGALVSRHSAEALEKELNSGTPHALSPAQLALPEGGLKPLDAVWNRSFLLGYAAGLAHELETRMPEVIEAMFGTLNRGTDAPPARDQ